MAWILMQPAKDDESTKSSAHLDITGKCLFDMNLNGARLKPISYESLVCIYMELKIHSFVSEAASG